MSVYVESTLFSWQNENTLKHTSDKQLKVLCYIWHPGIPIACHTGVGVCVIIPGGVEGQITIDLIHIIGSYRWYHHGVTEADTRVHRFIQQDTIPVPVDVWSWDASGSALECHFIKLVHCVVLSEYDFRNHC